VNLHTQRNYGCSRTGTPAKSMVPMAKSIKIITFWRHSAGRGHRYLIEKPQVVSTFKKTRANDTTATVINDGVGNNE
jgi:hypothetical protein